MHFMINEDLPPHWRQDNVSSFCSFPPQVPPLRGSPAISETPPSYDSLFRTDTPNQL